MRIQRVDVVNFRSLRDCTLNLANCTALLGENNSGKSTFLHAIDLFFASSPRTTINDFSDGKLEKPIDITVHFGELTPYDQSEFAGNLLDDALVVTRRFTSGSSSENGTYFVSARVNLEFSACRNQSGKTEKRTLYSALREKYTDLPKEKNADEVNGFLEAWEEKNPSHLTLERVADFKGWTNVAAGKLKQKTSYQLIRAVQDASEQIQDNKNSPVKSLIDELARQTIQNNSDFKDFLSKANEQISKFTDPKNVPMLAEISGGLTEILTDYYKDSEIMATWEPISQIQPSFPSANIVVRDNEFETGLSGVGHGLQRAIILTVLRYMAEYRAKQSSVEQKFDEPQSDLILAIEEPEIYQHPTKQRLFGKLLRELTIGFSQYSGIRVQTIFVTHSPLLISIAECESIRLVRSLIKDSQRNVHINELSLERCAKSSAEFSGLKPENAWSAMQFAAKLHTFNSNLAEGFFAKCVVLAEGVGDEAVLNAWYRLKKRDPHAEGIVICQVDGKSKLDKPIIVFGELGIPCYWVFDSDKVAKDNGGSIKTNKLLQVIGGVEADKCEDWPVGEFKRFACWEKKIEKYIEEKVGTDAFTAARKKFSILHDISEDSCLKFPASASGMLLEFCEKGAKFPELDNVIAKIDELLVN